MPEIHVPLVGGIHQETEAKLLPQGRLLQAENIRFTKESRIISRNGYAFIQDDNRDFPALASAAYARKRTVHLGKANSVGAAKWWQRTPDDVFTVPDYASCLSSFEAPSRTVATPTIRFGVAASDIAITNGYLFVVYNDYDAFNSHSLPAAQGGLFYVVYHRSTMRIVASGVIVDFDEAASSFFNPKCIKLGQDVIVFYFIDDTIRMWKFSTVTLTGASVTLNPTLDYPSPITGHHASFDVCPYDDSSQVVLCFEGISGGISTGIAANRVDASGNRASMISVATFGADPKQVGIARFGPLNQDFGIACITNGNVKYASYTNGGVAVIPVSDIDSTGNAIGAPCICQSADHGNMVAWAWYESGQPSGRTGAWAFNGWGGGPAEYFHSLYPASKPFESPDGTVLIWCVDETHNPSPSAGTFGTYRLVEIGNLNIRPSAEGKVISPMVCAQEQALAGNWYASSAFEQRRHTAYDSGFAANTSAIDMRITALPTLVGATNTAGRVDFVEFRSGKYTDRWHAARLNGQLFFSGARMTEFDGSQLYESGLFQGPKEMTVEVSAGPNNFFGNRHYCAIWKWIDAGGRVHRSEVSTPVLLEGGGESTGALVTIAQPAFSDRQAHGSVTIFAEIYRTVEDGTVFYLLNPNDRVIVTPDLSVPLTFQDDKLDDEISANETIYIGDGTIIDNGEPPPCKYIWAGEDRLIVGGLEDRTQYAFSKRVRPGNGVAFPLADELNFRGSIEGEVTGVAQLDGVWFIGSTEAIWAVTGEGPNDEAVGEFSRARKLPSDTGFVSQRSICEVPQGLLFQGRGNKMYLLPRGGGAPVWVGKVIQDILAEFPLITCCVFFPEEHVAIFVCVKLVFGDDSSDDARFLIYDTEYGEWSIDKPFAVDASSDRVFSSVALWNAKPIFDSNVQQTSAWTDDVDGASPTWITILLETGDIRFFGAAGHGRVRRAHVLGESFSANVNMVMSVSRDSGQTYDSPAGVWTAANPFNIDRQYELPYVRGTSYRILLTVTPSDDGGAFVPGQGVALNALSFEVFPERGLKRLAGTARV